MYLYISIHFISKHIDFLGLITIPSLNSQLLLPSMTSEPASMLCPELVTSCSLEENGKISHIIFPKLNYLNKQEAHRP